MPNPIARRLLHPVDPNYLDLNFATLPNGPVPGMLGSTWDVASGVARNNPTIGPTELLSNPNFDSDVANWNNNGGVLTSTAGGQSGNCCTYTANGGGYQDMRQNITTTANKWLVGSLYVKSGTAGDISKPYWIFDGDDVGSYQIPTTIDWIKYTMAGRVKVASASFVFFIAAGIGAGLTNLVDTTSLKMIADETQLFNIRKFSSQFGSVRAAWTRSYSTCPMGVVMCADYPRYLNYVFAYQRDGVFRMYKVVNGVHTSLIATGAAYAAGKNMMIKRTPGTNIFSAWYGAAGSEIQVGTDQTINDVSIINNKYHGLFDTSPQLNTCSRFIYSAAG